MIVLVTLSALPIGFYYFFVLKYGSNIPISDDFEAVLDFLNHYYEVSAFHDRVALIFSQHNEHRIVLTRLVVLAQHYLLRTINFKTLLMIGNIGIIGILIVIYLSHNRRNPLWFTPVIFILFEPQYFGAIFFAMCSIQTFYALLFAFTALSYLSRDASKYFILAAVLATISTFTSGNGILCFVAGVVPLLTHKRFKLLIIWILIMVINCLIYFHGYSQPLNHPSIIKTLTTQPTAAAVYFIMLLGNILYIPSKMDTLETFSPALYLPLTLGALIFAFFIFLSIRKYYLRNTSLYSFFVFILLSEAVTAAARSGLGLTNALTTRYIIMSALLLIICYLALIETLEPETVQKFFYVGLAAAIVFNCTAFYLNYEKISTLRTLLKRGFLYFQVNKDRGLAHPDQIKARMILLRAIDMGYYRVPELSNSD
ncbi:MAG: hypothetical protein HQK97_08130 [Nitrospirae bacterium]|nr:hypothetical protein [Nitrospirota bacterium]